jgi:diacylglycerol O-acyltransferase
MTPLDPQRPLWQFHLIEQLRRRQRGHRARAPLHRRRHRADLGHDVSITDGGGDPPRRRPDGTPTDWLADAVLKPLTERAVKAIAMYGAAWWSLDMRHPQQPRSWTWPHRRCQVVRTWPRWR